MSNYTNGFQKMVNFANAQTTDNLEAAVFALTGRTLSREEQLSRSALLVAYENRMGADACELLMDKAGI